MIAIVASGDTLSDIASQHGVSLSAIESANPSVTNPDAIYVGEKIIIPSGGSWAPAPAPTASTSSSSGGGASSGANSSSSGGFSVPGMPASLASCIAFRESTNGTASSNVFGIIPASGYNVAGDSLAQQEQVAGQLYAQYGGSPWAADGCPGT